MRTWRPLCRSKRRAQVQMRFGPSDILLALGGSSAGSSSQNVPPSDLPETAAIEENRAVLTGGPAIITAGPDAAMARQRRVEKRRLTCERLLNAEDVGSDVVEDRSEGALPHRPAVSVPRQAPIGPVEDIPSQNPDRLRIDLRAGMTPPWLRPDQMISPSQDADTTARTFRARPRPRRKVDRDTPEGAAESFAQGGQPTRSPARIAPTAQRVHPRRPKGWKARIDHPEPPRRAISPIADEMSARKARPRFIRIR